MTASKIKGVCKPEWVPIDPDCGIIRKAEGGTYKSRLGNCLNRLSSQFLN